MKNLRKFGALLLALVMALSLSATALAAEVTPPTYSITINGAVEGETYSAYKIFDVTIATTTEGEGDTATTTETAYSYTIDNTQTTTGDTTTNSNPWFDTIQNFKVKKDGTDTAVFALTQSAGDAAKWVVKVNEGFGESEGQTSYVKELAQELNAAYLAMEAKPDASSTATGTEGSDNVVTATIDVSTSGPGYYFVDSSLGALCSLDTVNGTDVTIDEKNYLPNIDKQVFDPDSAAVAGNYTPNVTEDAANGVWRDVKDATDNNVKDGTIATVDVCQTVYYRLIINTDGKQTDITEGQSINSDYIIEDVLPTGFTYTNNSVAVTANTGENGAEETWDATDTDNKTNYTVTWTASTEANPTNAGTLKITLKSTGKLGSCLRNTQITITYAATMTNSQVAIGGAGNINTVKLFYQQTTEGDTTTNRERDTDSATVYTYQIGGTNGDGNPIIQKVDGTEGAKTKPLAGVKFILSKTVNNTTYYATVSNVAENTDGSYYLTGWTETKPDSGNIVTSAVTETTGTDGTATYSGGTIEVKGLDAGTYILTEVETLPGYNLLDDTITVVITENGTVTYKKTSDTDENAAQGTITIVNNTGTALPSTGGIGTTIFYVVGGALVLGAAVLLVVKRRMDASK